jgi:hypothetical protein
MPKFETAPPVIPVGFPVASSGSSWTIHTPDVSRRGSGWIARAFRNAYGVLHTMSS